MIYTSTSNEKIKNIKKLQNKKYRDQENLFIVEGEHLVKEAFSLSMGSYSGEDQGESCCFGCGGRQGLLLGHGEGIEGKNGLGPFLAMDGDFCSKGLVRG